MGCKDIANNSKNKVNKKDNKDIKTQENQKEVIENQQEKEDFIEIKKSEYENILNMLQEKEKKCEEYKDYIQRKEADYQNFRKKLIKEKEEHAKYANQGLIQELLPIIDNLRRAATFCENVDDIKPLSDGVCSVIKQFLDTLRKFGVEEIPKLEKFNFTFHEAIETQETSDVPEGTIMDVFQEGYTFYGKVIRPSLVKVSKLPSSEKREVTQEDENIKN